MENTREIGQRFKAVRDKVGYMQGQVGKMLGRSRVHYAKMESGVAGFSEDVLSRFCRAFSDDPGRLRSYLLEGGDMPAVRSPSRASSTTPTHETSDDPTAYAEPVVARPVKRNPPRSKAPTDEVRLDTEGRQYKVPILGIAQAAGYEPALESIVDFVGGFDEEEMASWSFAKPGWFTLIAEGDSQAPDFPNGTRFLVAGGEFPQRGDMVAAKLESGQVVVKRYQRRQNVIKLTSRNSSGKNFEWHIKENPHFCIWMFPVVRAEIDLRDQRWERTRTGTFEGVIDDEEDEE